MATFKQRLEALATDSSQPAICRAIAVLELRGLDDFVVKMGQARQNQQQQQPTTLANYSEYRNVLADLKRERPATTTAECRPAPSCTHSSVYVSVRYIVYCPRARKPFYYEEQVKLY